MRNTKQPTIACAIRSLTPDPTPVLHRYLPHLDGEYTRCIVAGGVEPYSKEVTEHLQELAAIHGVEIIGVSGAAREVLHSGLAKNLDGHSMALRQLERLRLRRRDSYGVATDDAYLAAEALGVDMIQFVDDDTGPITGVDVIARHRDVLNGRQAVAVTGTYLGTPWLDTSFFPRPAHGACFAAEFMRHLPSRGSIQADATSLSAQLDEAADYLIGGNNMVARELFSILPCCAALESIGTDDIFYGALANSLFPGRVRRNNASVIHFHTGGRKALPSVRRYFRNLSRAVAFFALLDEACLKHLTTIVRCGGQAHQPELPPLQEQHAREAVSSFFAGLKRISKEAGDCLTHPVRLVIDELSEQDGTVLVRDDLPEREDVVRTAQVSLAEYVELLSVWPAIVSGLDAELSTLFQTVAKF